MGTMAAKLSPAVKALAREKDSPRTVCPTHNLPKASSLHGSLSLLPNSGAHPKIQLPPILFGALATQVHTCLQPGRGGGPGPPLDIPCCRLACYILGRTSWEDHSRLEEPTTGEGQLTHPAPPGSWTPLPTHGADTGSEYPQNGGKGSALYHCYVLEMLRACRSHANGREKVLGEGGPGEL